MRLVLTGSSAGFAGDAPCAAAVLAPLRAGLRSGRFSSQSLGRPASDANGLDPASRDYADERARATFGKPFCAGYVTVRSGRRPIYRQQQLHI